MASKGSNYMVTWIIFKNHLLEVGLTQNWETMALQTLTTIDLFYSTICEDPHEHNVIETTCSWRPGHIWLHTTLEDPWPHYMILKAFGHFSFGLSQCHGHGSWLVCEVALLHGRISSACKKEEYSAHASNVAWNLSLNDDINAFPEKVPLLLSLMKSHFMVNCIALAAVRSSHTLTSPHSLILFLLLMSM